MKTIGIGDIHGYGLWKRILEKETLDKVIILADYFDSKHVSAQAQKDNFRDIISYKESNPDKCVLLFGNHDYHYLRTATKHHLGFQASHKTDIQELLHGALDKNLIQMCFVLDNLMFSHAGVTQTWCDNNDIKMESVEQDINDLFKYRPEAFKFISGVDLEESGDDPCQSPIWVRPRSLMADKIPGFIHIVGHTPKDKIMIYDDMILIDTLGTSGEYLVYENGKFATKTL